MEPLPRHWAHVDADIPLPEAASTRRHRAPGTTRVRLWGGSPVSEADALARARERQERLEAQGLPAGRRTAADGAGWYYPSGQVREEIVEEVEGGSGLIGVVTRNRYGALVLNTDAVLIADVDRQDDGDRPARRRLFGRKKQTQQHADPAEQNLLEAARALAAEHPDWGVHVHRTRAGFRVLISGADAAPGSPLSEQVLSALGTDPLYATLCRAQGTYRARLSPKPWRLPAANGRGHMEPLTATPGAAWPLEDEGARGAREAWVRDYEAASTPFSVTRRLWWNEVLPGDDAQQLLALHDRAGRADDGAELA
jgi:hypothetical protein